MPVDVEYVPRAPRLQAPPITAYERMFISLPESPPGLEGQRERTRRLAFVRRLVSRASRLASDTHPQRGR